tara:strand:- start:50403 stop:50855 length:453 start_codon:yes stop_codon:yes gene_type:complete
MTINAKVSARVEIIDAQGNAHTIGPRFDGPPSTIAAASDAIHDQTISISPSQIAKLFDQSQDLTSFDIMVVLSDTAGQLELVGDAAGASGLNYLQLPVHANIPFIIHGDTTRASDGTVALFDGTVVAIDEVRFKNSSATATAIVRVMAAS